MTKSIHLNEKNAYIIKRKFNEFVNEIKTEIENPCPQIQIQQKITIIYLTDFALFLF